MPTVRRPPVRARIDHHILVLVASAVLVAGGCGGGGSSAGPAAPRCTSVAGVWQASWALPVCVPQVGGTVQVTLTENADCLPSFAIPSFGMVSPDPARPPVGLTVAMEAGVPGLDAGCSRTLSAELQRSSPTELVVPFGGNCCHHGSIFLRR